MYPYYSMTKYPLNIMTNLCLEIILESYILKLLTLISLGEKNVQSRIQFYNVSVKLIS